MDLPNKEVLDKYLTKHGYYDIIAKDCVLFIAPRPHYCDRGSYLVNIKKSNSKVNVDFADLFPHYYFTFEAMMIEIGAWLKKRGQWE